MPVSFLPFSEMAKPFLLRNEQNCFQWEAEVNPGKYQLRGESLAWLLVNAKISLDLRTEAPGQLQLQLLPNTSAIMKYLDVELGTFPPSFLLPCQLPAQTCTL